MRIHPILAVRLGLPLLLLLLAGCASNEAQDPGESSGIESSEATDADMAEQGQEAQSVRDQKRNMMVQQYVERGRAALGEGRLAEAEDAAISAVRLDPSNAAARRLQEQVALAQGNPAGASDAAASDVSDRQRAKMQQLQADVQSQVADAEQMISNGNYDGAIGKLTLADSNIKSSSFSLDWGDTPSRIESLLVQARSERSMANEMDRNQRVQDTYDRLQADQAEAQAMQQARIDLMFIDAVDAFDNEDFATCSDLCESILRTDPLHEKAKEMRDSAWRARTRTVSKQFKESRTEMFKTWAEDLDEAKILQDAIMVTKSPERWAEMSARRAKLHTTVEVDADSTVNQQLKADIASQQIPSLSVQGETSLDAVIDQLRLFTKIPFVVTPDAVEAVDGEGIEFNLNLAHQTSVANALELITDAAGPDVVYTFRHGVVYITTRANANSELVLKPHDVKDLVAQVIDHSGPRIDKIQLPDDDFDDEDGTLFGGVFGDPIPTYDPDNLETLIRQSIAPTTWDEIDGVSIQFMNGFLLVNHTAEVQNEIYDFLEQLRRYTSSMVHIEARFLTITKDYLQEIGVDWRGNGGAGSALSLADLDDVTNGLEDNASRGLDNNGLGLPAGAAANPSSGAYFDEFGDGDIRMRTENIVGAYGSRQNTNGGLTMQLSFLDDLQYNLIMRAVEKNSQAQELQSTFLSAQNTQRAYATMLNQITYVQDFDVEVALAAFIADPVVGVVSDGIVLDVRPTISQNRKYIMLELRPTVATLVRPLPEFTSSLSGLTTPITIQLPELQVASANTTAVVPDGGTVVIGGLKKLFTIEQVSEIPFLAEIPILNLLFKTEGEASENRDVILMIKATIIDANDMIESLDRVASR